MTDQRTQSSAQLQALLTLVQLQRQARHAHDREALALSMVNELHRLIPYQQAVFWTLGTAGGVHIEAVSNVASVEANGPYALWLKQLVSQLRQHDDPLTLRVVGADSVPESLQQGWQEWQPGQMLWCPLIPPNGAATSGLLLLRDAPWKESEKTLLDTVVDAYAHAWKAMEPRRSFWSKTFLGAIAKRKVQFVIAGLLVAAMFIPVHETVLAPAEVAPRAPLIASAPLAGTVERIYVQPNGVVRKGEILFSLNDTELRSQVAVAEQAQEVVRADYLRASQKAFKDKDSLAQVAVLRAQVGEKTAELNHAREQLSRIEVRAEREGIAVFADANDWLGKPVSVGEKIMLIADPEQVELRAWVPVADAISLEKGAKLRLFLNTDPVHPLDAELYQAAFEAEVTDESVLAFRIKARFTDVERVPRIGLKGTVKIFGQQVLLGYYLLRRPFAATRQWLGW